MSGRVSWLLAACVCDQYVVCRASVNASAEPKWDAALRETQPERVKRQWVLERIHGLACALCDDLGLKGLRRTG